MDYIKTLERLLTSIAQQLSTLPPTKETESERIRLEQEYTKTQRLVCVLERDTILSSHRQYTFK